MKGSTNRNDVVCCKAYVGLNFALVQIEFAVSTRGCCNTYTSECSTQLRPAGWSYIDGVGAHETLLIPYFSYKSSLNLTVGVACLDEDTGLVMIVWSIYDDVVNIWESQAFPIVSITIVIVSVGL